MRGFAERRATFRPPLQEQGQILVVNEEQLRLNLGLVAAGLATGEVVIGADIALTRAIDIDMTYPVFLRGLGNARLTAKTPLDYAFGIEASAVQNRYLVIRNLVVGDPSDVEDAPFAHLVRGLDTDFRCDVLNSIIQTSTGLFDDDGTRTLRAARICDNDFITAAGWELATAMILQQCLIEGNTAFSQMNITDAAGGGGFNRINGNDLGTSGGTITTTAGTGFNVVTCNTHTTLVLDAADEEFANT